MLPDDDGIAHHVCILMTNPKVMMQSAWRRVISGTASVPFLYFLDGCCGISRSTIKQICVLLWQADEVDDAKVREQQDNIVYKKTYDNPADSQDKKLWFSTPGSRHESILAPGAAGLAAGAAVVGDSFSVKVEDVEEGAASPLLLSLPLRDHNIAISLCLQSPVIRCNTLTPLHVPLILFVGNCDEVSVEGPHRVEGPPLV